MVQPNAGAEKSAFLAIVGRPNVGKSSLLNAMLGQKLAIVSSKPQTTRTRIMGILTEGETQLVFLDTPGLHRSRNRLDDYMERSIAASVSGVDGCLLVVEAGEEIRSGELELLETIRKQEIPAVLVINKIDRLAQKEKIMAQISAWSALYSFTAVVPVSALNGDGVPELVQELKAVAPEGSIFLARKRLPTCRNRLLRLKLFVKKRFGCWIRKFHMAWLWQWS